MKSLLKKIILPLATIVALASPSKAKTEEQIAFDAYRDLTRCNSTQMSNKIIYNTADKLGNRDNHPSFQEVKYALDKMNSQSGKVADKIYGNGDGNTGYEEMNAMNEVSKTGNSALLRMAHYIPALITWEDILTAKPSPENQTMAQDYVELINKSRGRVRGLAIELENLQEGDILTPGHVIKTLEEMNKASNYVVDVHWGDHNGSTSIEEINNFIQESKVPGLIGWKNMFREFQQVKYLWE